MKTLLIQSITFIVLMLFCNINTLTAQETKAQYQERMKAIEKEEIYISNYINLKMAEPCSDELYKEFIETLKNNESHEHHKITSSELPTILAQFRRDHYRTQFMQLHPEVRSIFDYQIAPNSTKKTRGGALVCANGTLETNLTGFNAATGIFFNGVGLTSACEWIQSNTQPNMNPGFANVTWVPNGLDPIAPILQTHNNSSGAVRINSTAGDAPNCLRNGRMNQLSMPFTPSMSGSQSIAFSFALLLESPGHATGTNPFFVARVLNTTTGIEESRFCIESTPNNPFFTQANLHDPNYPNNCIDTVLPMQYVDWTCAALNFEGNINHNYVIDFFVAGCNDLNAGGHFGYAYVDDICINCELGDDVLPSVTLQPTDTCIKNMTVCASYTLPINNGNIGTLITSGVNQPTLTVFHNGFQIGVPLTGATIDPVNHTICFNVTPAILGGLLGGVDFEININFNLNGGVVPASDLNTNAGLNNDYTSNLCCSCGSWTNILLTGTNGTALTPAFYTCGTTINNRPIKKGGSYNFRFKFNCVGSSCTPTYTFTENLNGVVTSTLAGGAININFVPNQQDCGLRSITVTPNCGGIPCAPCTIYFPVTGCDECIEPVNKTIMCDPSGKPVINFCLKNLDPVAVQFFGITIPTNIQFTTVSLPAGATLIYTHPTNGMRVYKTSAPIATGDSACSFRFRIDGGIYKNQQLCLELKRFTLFDQYGNFLNCCIDPIPLCFTIPDCTDDCADIVNASISCNLANQRVLTYQVKNNTGFNITGYESFRIGAIPNDYFAGFFIPSVAPGAVSQVITHIIPNSIPSGSTYCFTNTVHYIYYTPSHTCDTICYSDTLCLTVPYCGVIGDTIKGGGGSATTAGYGLGKSANTEEETSIPSYNNFVIYPNPTDGMLHVESFDSKQPITTLRLQDLSGREVYFEKYENSSIEKIDIQKLPSGMYILTINDKKQLKVIKK